jgi:hypothetical protein
MTLARVRALIVIGVLSFTAVTTVVWAIVQDDQGTSTRRSACGGAATTAAGALPPPKSVRVRVLNATDVPGLATTVERKLRTAGFTVVGKGNESRTVESSAQVRFGPKGLGAAALLRAYVKGSETVQDNKRKDGVVDLVLGDEFPATGITPNELVKGELDRLGPLELETDETC